MKQLLKVLIEALGPKIGLNQKMIREIVKLLGLNGKRIPKKGVAFAAPVDGDTSKFYMNGNKVTVRYLLIDTPESVKPNTPVQPFGKEASAFTRQALTNAKQIELDFDQTGWQGDQYGRKLAYVYVDGKDLNEELLKRGLARVAFVHEPNTTHVEKYRKAEAIARNAKRGIWSIDGYVTKRGYRMKND